VWGILIMHCFTVVRISYSENLCVFFKKKKKAKIEVLVKHKEFN